MSSKPVHFTLGRHNRDEYLRKKARTFEEARAMICKCMPDAVDTIGRIVLDPRAPDRARLMAVTLILDRTMGLPDRDGIPEERSIEECARSLRELFGDPPSEDEESDL